MSAGTLRVRFLANAPTAPTDRGPQTSAGSGAGFEYCQCTWYANYRRPDIYNYAVQHGVSGTGWDGRYWASKAAAAGELTGTLPVRGALVSFQPGGHYATDPTYGHVAYVESVAADGRSFTTSEMSGWDCGTSRAGTIYTGHYTAPAAGMTFIYGPPGSPTPGPSQPPAGGPPAGGTTTPPPQTGPIADLGFIKLQNTAGTVEVHWDTLQGGSLRRAGDYPSDFSPGDAGNGVWQLFGWVNGAPELGFIKLRNTAGTVEVHWDTLQGGSYKRAGDYTSDFNPGDAGNGTWDLLDSSNGAPVLGFVKVRNTAGTVEAHWDTLQGGSYKRAGDYTSDFSPLDATNGIWQLFGSANGAPELGFIKLQNTAGTVEVHWDTLQGGAFRRAGDFTSDFSPADSGNGTWNLFGSANGAPELGFVKMQNVGSGTVEGHADALSGSSFARTADYASDFSPLDAANGSWQIGFF